LRKLLRSLVFPSYPCPRLSATPAGAITGYISDTKCAMSGAKAKTAASGSAGRVRELRQGCVKEGSESRLREEAQQDPQARCDVDEIEHDLGDSAGASALTMKLAASGFHWMMSTLPAWSSLTTA